MRSRPIPGEVWHTCGHLSRTRISFHEALQKVVPLVADLRVVTEDLVGEVERPAKPYWPVSR